MRYPLIVGVKPSNFQTGSRVMLKPGYWDIVTDAKDSRLVLVTPKLTHTLQGSTSLELDEPTPVYVQMKEVGSESFISVFAEQK